MKSRIYFENITGLDYTPIRNFIKGEMAKQVVELYGKLDVIGGVATGASGIGALVADVLGLPFVYVRPEPKSHGRKNQVEGHLEKNQTVVVIEDLISTGKSSLNAVDALRQEGANVKGMLAIFTYGFETATSNSKEKELKLNTLSSYEYLIEQASETGYIKEDQLRTLKEWRVAPSKWLQ